MKIAITAIAAIAGAATASPYFTAVNEFQGAGTVNTAGVATMTIDLTGVETWDGLGAAGNPFYGLNLGANTHIIGLGWDVGIATYGASWLSEPTFSYTNTDLSGGVYLTPGIGDDFAGTASYSSGGILDLIGTGLDFFLNADGLLNVEIFESFDDVGGAADAMLSGSIQIQYVVPAPGALAMLGLGGLVAGRRRR